MAAVVDTGNSPIRFTGFIAAEAGITSASFTAPANSLIVVGLAADTTPTVVATFTVADSGGLSWTKRVAREGEEATAGATTAWWTAPQVTSASRTVTATRGADGGGTKQVAAKIYVVTGADLGGTPVDSVSAANEGGSATNDLTTTAVTPGATGLLFAQSATWNSDLVFEASTDLTQDTAGYAAFMAHCSGYKTCTSGVGVTANLNAAGTADPQHKWCQIVVRAAAGGGEEGPPINVRLDEPELGSGEFE